MALRRPFTEDNQYAGSAMTRMNVASGWRPKTGGGPAADDPEFILSVARRSRPLAGVFRVSLRVETDVAAWVLERAAGKSLCRTGQASNLWPTHRRGPRMPI